MLIGLVGDLLVNRERPADVFRHVGGILRAPEMMFGNLEGAYSDNPVPVPGASIVIGAPWKNVGVYADVGFSVLAMASNHILDMGYEAMLETRRKLRAGGIQTCGVGDCEDDARQPAILVRGGMSVAFLAYASTFPIGYEARRSAPGLAPMRNYHYLRDSAPGSYPGGYQPLVTSIPDTRDLAALAEDIRKAQARADLVITSFHWGDYSRPFHLTDHETTTAKYCIDQGADMVIGHHHHALRGMEWYKGKPIMYGLGHFIADFRFEIPEEIERLLLQQGGEKISYRVGSRKGWPLLPLHEDTRMTVMAWADAEAGGVKDIGFLPCRLTPDGLVHPLQLGTAEANEVVAYLGKCIHTQSLNGSITAQGARLLAGFSTLRVIPA